MDDHLFSGHSWSAHASLFINSLRLLRLHPQILHIDFFELNLSQTIHIEYLSSISCLLQVGKPDIICQNKE